MVYKHGGYYKVISDDPDYQGEYRYSAHEERFYRCIECPGLQNSWNTTSLATMHMEEIIPTWQKGDKVRVIGNTYYAEKGKIYTLEDSCERHSDAPKLDNGYYVQKKDLEWIPSIWRIKTRHEFELDGIRDLRDLSCGWHNDMDPMLGTSVPMNIVQRILDEGDSNRLPFFVGDYFAVKKMLKESKSYLDVEHYNKVFAPMEEKVTPKYDGVAKEGIVCRPSDVSWDIETTVEATREEAKLFPITVKKLTEALKEVYKTPTTSRVDELDVQIGDVNVKKQINFKF